MAAPNFRTNTNCLTTTLSPSIAFFFLASNSIGTIYRAYYRRDYYTVGFVLFEYSAFLLLDLCLTAFHKLPSQNRTKWRKFLQLAIWVFYSAIVFGISTYFGPLFGDPYYGYSLYVVSVVGSVLLFYVYVIWDGSESGCDEYCLGEEKVTTEVNTRFIMIPFWRRYDSCWTLNSFITPEPLITNNRDSHADMRRMGVEEFTQKGRTINGN